MAQSLAGADTLPRRRASRARHPVENAIRPICLTRKNALFGSENWAFARLDRRHLQTQRRNPAAYIAETLEAIIDGHRHGRIEDFMPW